jgi:2-dehydropantoate 2-reductase
VRYVIYGAGAVGGVIGARLHQAGRDVVLIARGPHKDAMQEKGLTLEVGHDRLTLSIPVVGHPSELRFTGDDVVVLTMKSQDTQAALDELRNTGGEDLPIFCAQNGVTNERFALRRFDRVYGVLVILPATHLEPGVVQANSSNKSGILDLGRYPKGSDGLARAVADDLNAADFSAEARDDIMRWKFAKLLGNLGNILQAACGPEADTRDVYVQLRDEALSCYQAAGIDCASGDEMGTRRDGVLGFDPVSGGQRRLGGSTWQSLERSAGSIETDFLNGEISLLGRLHDVPTPANQAVQRIAWQLTRDRRPPGSFAPDDLRRQIGREVSGLSPQQ